MGWQVYRNIREEWYYKAIATGVLPLSIFVEERCDEHLVKRSYDKHGLIRSLQSSIGAQLSYERNEYGELICSPSRATASKLREIHNGLIISALQFSNSPEMSKFTRRWILIIRYLHFDAVALVPLPTSCCF